jgi:Family of unknown function (DUF6228)
MGSSTVLRPTGGRLARLGGERHWRALEGELEVQASHHGARVLIAVTVRRPDMTFADDAWEARIFLTLEPGEQLDRVARDLASALASDQSPSHRPR